MAAVHKISGDFYDDSFVLIALHSSLESHSMAYVLNDHLHTRFDRWKNDLELAEDRSFELFEWNDSLNGFDWFLMANRSISGIVLDGPDLFKEEISFLRHYLIPEMKEVDYFIKLGGEEIDQVPSLLKSLRQIPNVITTYSVEPYSLKSRTNLIF